MEVLIQHRIKSSISCYHVKKYNYNIIKPILISIAKKKGPSKLHDRVNMFSKISAVIMNTIHVEFKSSACDGESLPSDV